MIQTLKRIEPLQAGKITGAIYGLMTLIFVPFFLIFAVIAMIAPQAMGSSQNAMPGVAGGVMFLVLAVMMPIFYGVFGFIFGVIAAWIYNLAAKWIGGIRYEVEQVL